MTSTILIIEDDPHSVQLASLYLERDGHRVVSAGDGKQGLELAAKEEPDLVLLDLMLPEVDGMAVCRTLRSESDVPIIMVTARVEEEDRTAGLDLGADDYVVKPFSPRELAARVRAVLRRTARERSEPATARLVFEGIELDLRKHAARLDGEELRLTPTEFRLLRMFLREPGRTFTRDQIIEHAFGYDFDGFDRTVDSHMSSLRHKLEAGTERGRYIQTVYGVGYRLGTA